MLNEAFFTLIAGNPTGWDTETTARTDNGESLTDVQEDQQARGRRSAEIIKGIHGFYLRYASGLDGFGILARAKGDVDGTLDSAIAWGENWANEDPDNREVFIRTDLLENGRLDDGFPDWVDNLEN